MSNSAAAHFLSERVALLDAASLVGDGPWQHAVAVMSSYTNTSPTQDLNKLTIDPQDADDAVTLSARFQYLLAAAPHIVRGPVDRQEQVWATTGRSAIENRIPSRQRFAEPTVSNSPVGGFSIGGLFTSTAITAGRSMWQMYLEPYEGSEMFPDPWAAWSMPVAASAVVAEISSATAWVNFVARYPRLVDGLIYPDWHSAAADYDGVHISLAAVIAGQGWLLRTADGIATTGASYWDTECTFWLQWKFGEPVVR